VQAVWAEGTVSEARIMLFMVIESFRDKARIGERFARHGRMLPEGVAYHASWVDTAGTRCFQVMEAPDRQALHGWISRWDDLVDFEIIPVLTSGDFWSKAKQP
jgi:Protein of unknown function (DUF3303)